MHCVICGGKTSRGEEICSPCGDRIDQRSNGDQLYEELAIQNQMEASLADRKKQWPVFINRRRLPHRSLAE